MKNLQNRTIRYFGYTCQICTYQIFININTNIFAPKITIKLRKAKAKKTFLIARQAVDHVCTKYTACTFLNKVKCKTIQKKENEIFMNSSLFWKNVCIAQYRVCKENTDEEFLGDELEKENTFYFCFQDSTQDKQIEFIRLRCLVVDITTQKKFRGVEFLFRKEGL